LVFETAVCWDFEKCIAVLFGVTRAAFRVSDSDDVLLRRLRQVIPLPAEVESHLLVVRAERDWRSVEHRTRVFSILRRAIELQPDSQYAYFTRGLLFSRIGQFDRAVADFARSLEFAHTKGRYRFDTTQQATWERGKALAALGRYPEAIADYSVLIAKEESPRQAQWYVDRAVAFLEAGEYRSALKDLCEVIHDGPGFGCFDPEAFFHRARAYRAIGKQDKANEDLQQAIALLVNSVDSPSASPDRCLLRGKAHQARGDKTNAEGDYRKAIRIVNDEIENSPKDVSRYVLRASIYDALGEHKKAQADREFLRQLAAREDADP
jgi:tetratricopeptide (TPR) repeat protein